MPTRRGQRRIHPLWWTAIMFTAIAAFVVICSAAFAGTFRSFQPVTVTSDRSGLVMEPGAKVKMRGVPVGRVASVHGGAEPVHLTLELFPDQVRFIPANVVPQIRATTAFGAKYVDLIYPDEPASARLAPGAVLASRNVSTEVNTVFENIVKVLGQIDPPKLNPVLTALADGVRGQGPRIGQATTDANEVLLAVNSRDETLRRDWRALAAASDAYGGAAQHIIDTLAAASVTSRTVTGQAQDLDALLLSTIGLGRSGVELLAPSHTDLIRLIDAAEPTTNLLMKYNPTYTCLLLGANWALENGARENNGGNGRTTILDAGLLFGDDGYRFPDHLPIVAAKGGPGGKPSCGSLPDATKNYPVRQLITNTGWGTGLDLRPNPGIGHPCWANFFPATRAVPEPPSIRKCIPGPAIGPVPYPGAPPYGAPLYGPGGTPLWPGVPPADAGTPP
ncbi:MCE family protein [Micromonospora sp. WMMD736]|uniref:MCE family protein n=1 Tax=Micromonospora sp. WMMD736 TaxID=3404112 RepID=UPI003B93AEE2